MADESFFIHFLVYAIIGIVVIGVLLQVGASLGSGDASIQYPSDDWNFLAQMDDVPSDVNVEATTETAVYLDGESSIDSASPVGLDTGNWTACATTELDGNVQGTYNLLAYNSSSILIQYDRGNWTAYYDNGTADATVSLPATSDRTTVCSRYDGELQLIVNDDYSSQQPLTTQTTTLNTSWRWEGMIDEVRLFNASESNEAISGYMNDPVAPLPDTNRTARFMFDEGSGSTTYIYFVDEEVSIGSTTTWTDGIPNPADAWFGFVEAIEEDEDYELRADPFEIRILNGGYLEGAPVVHIEWSGGRFFFFNVVGLMATLMALLLIVVIANKLQETFNTGP